MMNKNLFSACIKPIFFSLLILIFFNSNAQEVEKYFDYTWKECKPSVARFYCSITKTDTGFKRINYFIHEKKVQMIGTYEDADCKIPNGHFKYFHANGVLDSIGRYVNGKKEGSWISYHNNMMVNDSSFYVNGKRLGTSLGWYENGNPRDSSFTNADGSGVGVAWFDNGNPASAGRYSDWEKKDGKWTYFHKNGKLSSLETYNHGKLVSKQYFDEEGNPIKDMTNNDRIAIFPGGIKAWKKYLSKEIYFPTQYKIVNSDKAIVVISFTINEDGDVENVFVSTPFYPEFDEIALNVIRKSPKWSPAILHNRRVKCIIKQKVVFANN